MIFFKFNLSTTFVYILAFVTQFFKLLISNYLTTYITIDTTAAIIEYPCMLIYNYSYDAPNIKLETPNLHSKLNNIIIIISSPVKSI